MPSLNRQGGKHVLLVVNKKGLLYAVEDPDNSDETTLILDIKDRVCDGGERGLQSVVVHPQFEQNRWIYLFYTFSWNGKCLEKVKDEGPINVVSRAKVNRNNHQVDISTEQVLFQTSTLFKTNHNGGAMLFGVDGMLYVTLGDGGDRGDRYSLQLDILLGKIIRLTDNGKVPEDNPFVRHEKAIRCHETGFTEIEDGVCSEIFAYGLRNPFRFTMDVNNKDSVRFYISDVGGSKWEEIDEGGAMMPGANCGWPAREGPCHLGSFDDCSLPTTEDYVDPIYWYAHDDDGGSVVGGTFIPKDAGWPEEFQDTFLFAEFVKGEIVWIQKNSDFTCRYCDPPISEWRNSTFHRWQKPVDLFFGPYGDDGMALYYTARHGRVNVRRIRYIGETNHPPVAVASADVTHGKEPLTIKFEASDSYDPEDDKISFSWDFGDNKTVSSAINPVVTFDRPGIYDVGLTVTDKVSGLSDESFIEIHVGVPPIAIMESPAEGEYFAVDDIFTLKGRVEDADGRPINNADISFEVRQHHNTHFHPYLGVTKDNNFALQPAPPPEDFLAATNSYLEVRMYARDSNGLVTTISRNVLPKQVTMKFDTVPSGLEVLLDDYPVTTPAEIVSWENHKLRVGVKDQPLFKFGNWSDGGSRNHEILVPSSTSNRDREFVVTFEGPDPVIQFPVVPDTACFSGETIVQVQNKGPRKMRDIQIGDMVRINHEDRYEKVYSFAHRDEAKSAEFLKLAPSNLELSPSHMVFVNARGAIPASMVKVGDVLSDHTAVEAIYVVSRSDGVYSPFTQSGQILVNNVVASTYISFQESDFVKLGSWNSPLTYQWLAHTLQAPYRTWCLRLGMEDRRQPNGLSIFVSWPLRASHWLLKQRVTVIAVLIIPIVVTGAIFALLESQALLPIAISLAFFFLIFTTRKLLVTTK